MPPRLRSHAIAAAEPSRAAHETVAAALRDAPRARPLVVMVASFGAHPGLRPAPWTLDGLVHAVEDSQLRGKALVLGDDGPGTLSAQLAAAGLPRADEDGRATTLALAGTRRTLRVPHAMIGSSLCIVVPCLHRQRAARNGRPQWRGPVEAALVELAHHFGAPRSRDPEDLAIHCIGELFAHVSVIVDASFWAPLSSDDEGAPMLLAPERILAVRLASPAVPSDRAIDPRDADAWIGAQLGLPLRRGEAPRVVGPAARLPWPRLSHVPSTPRGRGPGLAGQAVAALWRRNDAPSPRRAALPPAVPGSLAPLWDHYEPAPRPT